jgi:hypothetical protein
MYAPQSLHAHQSSLTTDLYKKRCAFTYERKQMINIILFKMTLSFFFLVVYSICSTLKRPSDDDEQIVKSEFLANTKRRSGAPSKMQQQTTDDSGIGVPSRLCSVCGDISTGK